MPLEQHPTDLDKMVYASRHYDIPQLQGVTTTQPAQEPATKPYRVKKRFTISLMEKLIEAKLKETKRR